MNIDLVMDDSWLMIAFVALVAFAILCSCYVTIYCILILFSYMHDSHVVVECLVGADRVCFAFGARFRAILAVYAC